MTTQVQLNPPALSAPAPAPGPGPAPAPTLTVLTSATFDEEVRGSVLPVLVDVWAEWCPPCKAIEPVLADIAAQHPDRLRVLKLNSDEHPDLVTRLGVLGLPTLLVFKDGEIVRRIVGAKGKGYLLEALDEFIS